MSNDINKAIVSGSLGADPEMRFSQSGTGFLTLRLCCTTSYLDRDKQRKERKAWLNCKVIGARAEPLSKILAKGQRVVVEGTIETGSYEDRNGQKRQTFEIVCQEILLAGGKRGQPNAEEPADRGQSSGGGYGGGAASAPAPDPGFAPGFGSEDDVPFAYIGADPKDERQLPRKWL